MKAVKAKPLRVVSPIHKAGRQMSLHLSGKMHDWPVRPGDCHLLSYLALYAPCSISDLQRVFGHKPTTLTSILDRLENGGYLKRTVNPADRRSFVVAGTAKGNRMGRTGRVVVEQFDADVCRRVSKADLAGFNRVMEALAEISQITLRKTK